MQRRSTVWLTGLSVLVVAVSPLARGDEGGKVLPFFAAAIRTEAQRSEISATASAFAIVDCNAFLVDSKFDSDAVDRSGLASQLRRVAAVAPEELKLVMRFHFPVEVTGPVRTEIKKTLDRISRAAGFRSVFISEVNTSVRWADQYAALGQRDDSESNVEPIIADRWIKAYPIRTKLSRLAIGDADGVIEIKQPFDGRQMDLSPELRSVIERAVRSMGLGPAKEKLLFRVHSTDAGRELVEQLFDARRPPTIPENVTEGPLFEFIQSQQKRYRPSPAMALARTLGFESIGYVHSPGGGAPEKLIGQTVPTFDLDLLGGGRLELSRFISGRPALVTFWGVACGPCRQVAPHLTRMNQKYEGRFAIVAVNGYDEAPDVVAEFAAQNRLEHPIVLGGGEVASNAYFVGAYPTTFFVDRQGTVVDYSVGFDSAEALESRISELVADDR
ncbi:Thiol-disulfide oxidoreductase ResA [Stieleria maiorica]|uniref:Thiol-disulfide oxidoreductase ResA n=1 Tax=Stieleria maiorica TaxID=2795974 RepID=A0A5B9MJF5_9BACT|nr:TlpA disulfide reductase family protein [Stieleria maiorica]QEG00101.1 Thiol-disulfide oxidoreductase ResA [Stieleria maiorica]